MTPPRPASPQELAELRLFNPLIIDLRDALVASGIARPEQGDRFIDAACGIMRDRRAERVRLDALRREDRVARPWWKRWLP